MEVDQLDSVSPVVATKHYTLFNQKVDLDIGFDQRIRGTSHLTIFPERPDLKAIVLNARQCKITNVTINGLKPDSIVYNDPCDTLSLHINGSVHQHHVIRDKITGAVRAPPEPELVIILPSQLKIKENPEFAVQTNEGVKTTKLDGDASNDAKLAESLADTAVSRYTKLDVEISFTTIHTRDALHFSVGAPGSGQWPHVYTRGGFLPGRASTLFPCMDSIYYRCTWEISITGPRTVGDALRENTGDTNQGDATKQDEQAYEALEMVYVCPGEVTDNVVSKDNKKRTVSYTITQNVSAQHIGFAIGPFEKVDLAALRDPDRVEALEGNATPIAAYCLPGRSAEAENTCLPTTEALDHFILSQAAFPFESFSYCFVQDHPEQPGSFAGLATCSTRMLYPETVIDPAQEVTRTLIQELTKQWLGIQIIPKLPEDTWVVLGSAVFIAELFMKELCGYNEYRFRMKTISDQVVEIDHERPSIWEMGAILHIDPSEYEFLAMKAPLVLYILDRRIAKILGKPKMNIVIGKFMSKARMEDVKDVFMSTQDFCRATEKQLHQPIDDFINQWVRGAGCPTLRVSQSFNRKKLVIEMTIKQTHSNNTEPRPLKPENFVRDVREEYGEVYATPQQPVFTGPMTVRIHEADGTPYEHIIHIREANQKYEIPYNTKYKRLKRGKKARARQAAGRGNPDDEQDSQVYMLGDIFQEDQEIIDWKISEISEEEEAKQAGDHYEWIRMDADFEWIADIHVNLTGPQLMSQLQQDRDVAAQILSIKGMRLYQPHPLVSSFLIKTVMDSRYFHGIRTMAAKLMVRHATNAGVCDMIGWFHLKKAYDTLFCDSDGIPKHNDFSSQLTYYLQHSLIEAISEIRLEDGYAPDEVKHFLLDKLKFNENADNDYSDAFLVSTLLKALTNAMLSRRERPAEVDIEMMDHDEMVFWADEALFYKQCLDEIDRYRRMDEWTSSYQNLYTRTALECQAKLSKAGVTRYSSMHFLQYARPGNYELLRCAAYDVLASDDIFTNEKILSFFIHGMVTANSPYVRLRMRQAFGIALARKAIGHGMVKTSTAPVLAQSEDLAVEGAPAVLAAPDLELDRTTTVEGALRALKLELSENFRLQDSLWQALCNPNAGYEDIHDLAMFCQMLYEQKDEGRVALHLPRYWKVESSGKGKLRFSRSNSVRTKVMKPWEPPKPEPAKPKASISLTSRQNSMAQPNKQAKGGLKLMFRQNSISQAGRSPSAANSTPTPPPATSSSAQSRQQPQQQGVNGSHPAPKLKLKLGRPSIGGQ